MSDEYSVDQIVRNNRSDGLCLLASYKVGDRVMCNVPVDTHGFPARSEGVPALIYHISCDLANPVATLLRGLEVMPLQVAEAHFLNGNVVAASADRADPMCQKYEAAFEFMERSVPAAEMLDFLDLKTGLESYNYPMPAAS